MILENYLARNSQRPASATFTGLALIALTIFCGFLLWKGSYFLEIRFLLNGSAIHLSALIAGYLAVRSLSARVARLFPDTDQSVVRSCFWFLVYGTVSVGLVWLVLLLHRLIGYLPGTLDVPAVLRFSYFILSGSLIATGLTELAYTFRQWRTNQNELEMMQELQLNTELEAVKQQVNPHFLFNCLNSLSVLIADAPAAAERFVDEMSKVYRYQLNVNGPGKENILVTLDSELRFIKSYIYLMETRFENGISIQVDVRDTFLNGQMVPLTFQILIDHAVHFNIVSPARPLMIMLATTETGQLEVRHNLQPKTKSMALGFPGMEVLLSRYRFLFNHPGAIQVREGEGQFSVTVPLIFT